MLIDRTRSTLHPGDIKKVRKTNWKGNQMPEQRHRFISYPSINMKTNAVVSKKTDGLEIEFTEAVAKYKRRTFTIRQVGGPIERDKPDYEISVIHDKLDQYGGAILLHSDKVAGFVSPRRIKTMKEAIEAIQDFISTELA